METKIFKKSDLKSEIVKTYGSISKFKKFLKENAKFEYGCTSSEITIYGCKIIYTDNENCFANFLVRIPFVGFKGEFALDKSSITKAGLKRSCADFYLF
jgi:hypothetical protein